MGAERWIDFGTAEERDRVVAYLRGLWMSDITVQDGESVAQVWVDPLDDEPCFAVRLGYSFGGVQSEDLAILVCRELARRFNVTRIGTDSIGWYRDSVWESTDPDGPTTKYGDLGSWVEWAKAWKPEWSFEVRRFVGGRKPLAFAQSLERSVVDLFKSLDKNET